MEMFLLKILKGVPLHFNTYTCKYQTATYLMRFVVVDIAYGIEIRPIKGWRSKFCCYLVVITVIKTIRI
jgi:hypothetical protein